MGIFDAAVSEVVGFARAAEFCWLKQTDSNCSLAEPAGVELVVNRLCRMNRNNIYFPKYNREYS
jgi:hypothetical protein